MSAYTPPRESNFIQISLSDFLESQKLESEPVLNGKLSREDEILLIFSLVNRALTNEELHELVKFVEHILGPEVIYGIPNHVTLSKLLHSLMRKSLIIQNNKVYEISKLGISSFNNSFQKFVLKKASLRRACRFLNYILTALRDKNPDIAQLKLILQQATDVYSKFSGSNLTFD